MSRQRRHESRDAIRRPRTIHPVCRTDSIRWWRPACRISARRSCAAERHCCTVAAVTGHDHEFLNAGARDAFADRGPGLQCDLGRQGQRTGKGEVLGRNAHRLKRQKRRRNIGGQQALDPLQDRPPAIMTSVPRGQVRPVLLGRGERRHCNPGGRIALGDVGPVNVSPVAGRHVGSHRGCVSLVNFAG